jgi:hypothetical protein
MPEAPRRWRRLCAIHHRRKLSRDLVLSFQRQRYIVPAYGNPRYALRHETVAVVVHPDQRIEIVHGQELLPYQIFDPIPVDDKTLNVWVDAMVDARRGSEKSCPAQQTKAASP